nr:CPBP family intramembrane glutamic endopeptidase [Bordetella petrii]
MLLIAFQAGPGPSRSLLGNALVFGAVVCESLFILLNKRLRQPLRPLAQSTCMTALGLGIAAAAALFEAPWAAAWPPGAMLAVAYYAAVPTVAGFLLWYAGAERVSGTEAALFTAVAPVAALLLAAGLAVRASGPPWRVAAGHALFIILAIGLSLHLLPGFHNAQAIDGARFSVESSPFSMYLNLDKPLVAFWVVLALAPAMSGRTRAATLKAALGACAVAVLACLGLALALGLVGWAPKWPAQGWLWLANNALLVALAEEALFRGYLQQQLAARWQHRRGGAAWAIVIAALVFGLAHAAGGIQWVALAGLAGLAYGVAYRYGGLAAAVLAHLGLNTVHFVAFTYPMRAAMG